MERKFCLIGFSYFTTLFLISHLPENIWIYIFGFFVVVLIASCLVRKFRKEKIFPVCFFVCSIAALVSIINFHYFIAPVEKLHQTEAVISGEIIELPHKKYNRYNYIVKVVSLDDRPVKPFKIKLSSPDTLEAEACDNIKIPVKFYLPKSNAFFDSKLYYRSRGIYILAYTYGYAYHEITPPRKFSIFHFVLNLRKTMLSLPKQVLNDRISNVINGLLLNEKHNFPEDVKNNFDRIGVYHLIATSGIHIAVLSRFCLWILKKTKFTYRSSALISSFIILLFMALTGFSGSIMRAGIVAILSSIGILIFRKPDPLNSLGLALLIICLTNPNAALDIGVCLSVFASLGIILIERKINKFINQKFSIDPEKNKILSYVVSIISVSIAASLFTFPISAWFFRKTSLIFLISNVLLIPLATVLINCVFLLQISMLIKLPQIFIMPIAFVCGTLTNLVIVISQILAKIPFALISLNYGFVMLGISMALVLVGTSLLLKGSLHTLKMALFLSLIINLGGYLSYVFLNYNATKLAVISSGDGVSIVISKHFRKAVILCAQKNFSNSNLNEHLFKLENHKLDYLSIPCWDEENCSQLLDIIEFLPTKNFVVAESLSSNLEGYLKKFNVSPMYFKDEVETKFWECIKTKTLKINDHVFILIQINDTKFLICCNGGDASKLPEEFKSCEFVIVNGLPINFEAINTNKFIVSSTGEKSEIILSKLFSPENGLYSLAHGGNVYINVDNHSKYKIRRFE